MADKIFGLDLHHVCYTYVCSALSRRVGVLQISIIIYHYTHLEISHVFSIVPLLLSLLRAQKEHDLHLLKSD